MELHVNDQSGLRGLPSLLTFDLAEVLRSEIFGLRSVNRFDTALASIMPGIRSATNGYPTYSAPAGSTAFDPNTNILYVNRNSAFDWFTLDIGTLAKKNDLDDLEQRFQMLAYKYQEMFDVIPGLEDDFDAGSNWTA